MLRRGLRVIIAAAGVAGFCGNAHAEVMTACVVLEKMSPGERVAFWAGIIEGLAQARYVKDNKDPAGRACIYAWFYDEPNSRDKIREASLKYPGALTGQIIGALVATKCGA